MTPFLFYLFIYFNSHEVKGLSTAYKTKQNVKFKIFFNYSLIYLFNYSLTHLFTHLLINYLFIKLFVLIF